jgi:3-deoxy-7-phosphoheptulonate synthase
LKGIPEYRLARKSHRPEGSVICIGDTEIGGKELLMIAGPCAVETEEQLFAIAQKVSDLGIKFLRGGAYKPRTSPYKFQGLQEPGLKLLSNVSKEFNLNIVTEVMDISLLDVVYPHTDIIQIGARNMKNYHLLRALGETDKPILLKRGMDATIEEWLLAAEYILLGGNEQVILCERGIRTFDNSNRNTLDLAGVALVKQLTHLPVIVDPSQATGNRNLIEATSLASIAVGGDGLMIEVHNNPEDALSDGPQSMYLKQFERMLPSLQNMATASNRIIDLKTAIQPVQVQEIH